MAFRSDYRDMITSVLTGDVNDAGQEIVQSQNATRLVLSGLESGFRHAPSAAWQLYATATCTRDDEEIEGDEYAADRIPPLFGKAGARWRFAPSWEPEGWALYAARQDRLSPRDATDARINPDGTVGRTTLNATVGWYPTNTLALRAGNENITDRRYREHGSGFDQPGRTVTSSLAGRF